MTTGSAPPAVPGPPPGERRVVARVDAMGTVISIDVRPPDGGGGPSPSAVRAALDAAADCLHAVDAAFSTWDDRSWVSRLRRGQVVLGDCPAEVREVFELCGQVEQETGGLFSTRWRNDGTPDPTGLVKGWAARRVSDLLRSSGLPDHCVNAAGDVVLSGCSSAGQDWSVGLADPRNRGGLLGVVDPARVTRAPAGPGRRWSVATSGITEQGLHIVDPRTGRPATDLLAATVVGPGAAEADGYATALVAAGRDLALARRLRARGWGVLLVAADGVVHDPAHLLASPWQA